MFKYIKSLFSQPVNRVVALVYPDGKVELFTKDELTINSTVFSFVNPDMTIAGLPESSDVQVMEIDIYDGVIDYPSQLLYSIPFRQDKMPIRNKIIPTDLFNAVWNFLEGSQGMKTNTCYHTFIVNSLKRVVQKAA